jgi:hypothetical protein
MSRNVHRLVEGSNHNSNSNNSNSKSRGTGLGSAPENITLPGVDFLNTNATHAM